ncbi:hypothetical protein B9G53_18405 [Pseudanabaena sp. SR411]|nr:hypothetical protein B9G53_18405 [Pseudanabaena sp. SR411]
MYFGIRGAARSATPLKLSKQKAALGAAFCFLLMMAISEENKEILSYINVLSIASMILSDFL